MPTDFPFTGRKKTRNRMAPRSAALLPPTGSSTVRKTITSKYQQMYDYFHLELLKRKFAMADETRVQVLNEE